jgi:Amt family ammonium transporter
MQQAQQHWDSGNIAFMLVSTSLVMLMTPGLAFFYGGLVGRKNVLTIMIQSFVSMSVTTLLWVVFGYSMSFSGSYHNAANPDIMGIIGNFHLVFFQNIDPGTPYAGSPTIPTVVFVAYQMMFAQITPALITGAFANRVTFKAYLIFLVAWLMLVYFPFAHMIWGGGILQANGVLDFAGGIVVHTTAGFAALAAVFYVGKRRTIDAGLHSIPLVALGTGLLWFGWYGFNAGSELKVDTVTSLAFLNTDLAASFAALTWLVLAWIYEKKPKFVGLLTGSIAGLATITPAAGYVSTRSAVIIGITAGVVCYYAVGLKNKLQWDDALDVWGVHGVGGALGVILLGVLANKLFNPDSGANGLLHGDSTFFMKELGAVALAAVYAFAFTYVMLVVINRITPVKVTAADEELGLDATLHGETAYL